MLNLNPALTRIAPTWECLPSRHRTEFGVLAGLSGPRNDVCGAMFMEAGLGGTCSAPILRSAPIVGSTHAARKLLQKPDLARELVIRADYWKAGVSIAFPCTTAQGATLTIIDRFERAGEPVLRGLTISLRSDGSGTFFWENERSANYSFRSMTELASVLPEKFRGFLQRNYRRFAEEQACCVFMEEEASSLDDLMSTWHERKTQSRSRGTLLRRSCRKLRRYLNRSEALSQSSYDFIMQGINEVNSVFENEPRGVEHARKALTEKLRAQCNGEPVRVRLLDNNIFYETQTEFGFLPLLASEGVSTAWTARQYLSVLISPALAHMPEGPVVLERFLAAMSKDDPEECLSVLAAHSAQLAVEVFSDAAGRVPRNVSCSIWREKFRQRLADKSMVRYGSHQLGYHRYIGFFEKMRHCDVFVFTNYLQFNDRDWQHRQDFALSASQIASQTHKVVVPIKGGSSKDALFEKQVMNLAGRRSHWARCHWHALKVGYSKTKYFARYAPFLERLYSRPWKTLGALDEALIRYMAKEFGIFHAEMLLGTHIGVSREQKKGRGIAAEIRSLFGPPSERCEAKVAYLAGSGEHYLSQTAAESGKEEKDFILAEGAILEKSHVDLHGIRAKHAINPSQSGMAFLFTYGPEALKVIEGETAILSWPSQVSGSVVQTAP